MTATHDASAGTTLGARPRRWPWIAAAGLAVLLLALPVGMLMVHKIDNDPRFALVDGSVPNGGSRAVAMAAALIHREVDVHSWVANDPWFMPGAWLDSVSATAATATNARESTTRTMSPPCIRGGDPAPDSR